MNKTKTKTKNKIIGIFLLMVTTALLLPVFPFQGSDCPGGFLVAGASPYKNQEQIPGQGSTDQFVTYIQNLYDFGIAITAILAVFMIAVGAFAYIVTSAGNASKMIDAKAKIINAIVGLVLAFIAFLVLYIINPDLVKGTMSGMNEAVQEAADDSN